MAPTHRIDVHAPDGTTLAVWIHGEGPAVVLVHGSPSEHSTFDPLVAWGHSYGCNPAMGAAARSSAIGHLVLYEPSFGLTYPAGAIDAIEAAPG